MSGFIGCESEPENHYPTGVYYNDTYGYCYVVNLQGHDIKELFRLKSSVSYLTAFDEGLTGSSDLICYATVVDGGFVGWNSSRFVYAPEYDGSSIASAAAEFLYYNKNVVSMSLERSYDYITCYKIKNGTDK